MTVWFRNYTVEDLNKRGKNTMSEHLDIRFLEMGEDYLKASMPVDHRTKQPEGLLHGGASVVLAETIMSTAGNLCLDITKQYCVGLEINANHISSCRDGLVVATAKPLHVGRMTQVWQTHIHQGDRLVCVSRMTLATKNRTADRK